MFRWKYALKLDVVAFLMLGFSLTSGAASIEVPGAELKHGRYIGWINIPDRSERIAVVADFFLEAPNSTQLFPNLIGIFKLSLGGYNTHEYITETFKDIHDDFAGGLTFDEPANDLVMTTGVYRIGSHTVIKGEVFIRSSAVSGSLELTYESDEPSDASHIRKVVPNTDGESLIELPFVPLLEGQYEGACDGKPAAFQFQTVRGLKTLWQGETESNSLGRYYGIVGRLVYKDSAACGDLGPNQWCTLRDYSGASYNFYLGKVNLHGPGSSEACTLSKGQLKCRVRIQGGSIDCDMKKKEMSTKSARFFSRQHNIKPTAEQKQEIPAAQPPKNEELSAAVRGTFLGYLHNETNNTYHVIRLNVTPYSYPFTNNSHNSNQMDVTTTAAIHLERNLSGPYSTQRYEPRSFYLQPGDSRSGFTLKGPNADSYINVAEWKRGYIRGTWYSHAFGKVGTVQLVKGALPAISEKADVVRSFAGEFEGPTLMDDTGTRGIVRWFKFLFPTQPNDLIEHLIRFTGSYQSIVGSVGIRDIERATFDPYTGRLGWTITHGEGATFASGFVGPDNNVRLYWPPSPNVFGMRTKDFGFDNFGRIAE